MAAEDIRSVLEELAAGNTTVDAALLALRKEPFSDLGYAKVDLQRGLRQGVAEVIYGAGKTPEQIARIVDLQMQRLRQRLEERKIKLDLTDAARTFMADAGYDPVYGARPLKRYVQQAVETPLARELVSGKIRDGQHVTVDVQNDALVFNAK